MKMRRMTLARAITPLLLALGGARLAQAQPATPDLLRPCVFAHDEILEALELEIEGSQLADMKLPGGRDIGCLYTIKHSQTVLTVRQTWDPAHPGPGTAVEAGFRAIPGDPDRAATRTSPIPGNRVRVAARTRPIPGKRDQAAARTGPSDEPGAEVVYWRGIVKTRLFVHGPTVDATAMLAKLLKLRRVP
jgi:hypothetical protein